MWGKPFEDEFSWNLWHFRGAVAMNNQGKADTNGSQFFIVQAKEVPGGMLEQMKDVEIVEPMVTILSRMKQSDRAALEALADALLA